MSLSLCLMVYLALFLSLFLFLCLSVVVYLGPLYYTICLSLPSPRFTLGFPKLLHQILCLLLNPLLHTPLAHPEVPHGGQRKSPESLPTFPVGKHHTCGDRHGLQRKLEGDSGFLSTPPLFCLTRFTWQTPSSIPCPPNSQLPSPSAFQALTISLKDLINNSDLRPARKGLSLVHEGLPDGLCPP